jgi:hypothetical protein|tara:strand:- start:119 stop:376 length:258 start_codon:yes stop_codon:yes gene_type:complete
MTKEKNQQITEGKHAQELLDNPLLVGAFNQILNDGYQKWISTEASAKEERESIYHTQVGLLKVKQILVATVENGKILEQEVKKNG